MWVDLPRSTNCEGACIPRERPAKGTPCRGGSSHPDRIPPCTCESIGAPAALVLASRGQGGEEGGEKGPAPPPRPGPNSMSKWPTPALNPS